MDIIQFRRDFDTPNDEELKQNLIKDYSFAGFKPEIRFSGDFILIHIDDAILQSTSRQFDKASDLCNAGRYKEAIPLFEEVVKTCPLHVDAYRSMAQAWMMLGDLEKALDVNLETLRIDGGNVWGLILMGNIFLKMKQPETALDYYKKVADAHPTNALALTNIGAALLSMQRYDEAISFFEDAISADDTNINTFYGYALAYFEKGDMHSAWEAAFEGMKKGVKKNENPGAHEQLTQLFLKIAQKLQKENDGITVEKVVNDIENQYHTKIKFQEDNTLKTYAQLSYGPAHNQNFHVVRYNKTSVYMSHFMMHELMHLQMALAASKIDKNLLVISNQDAEKTFIKHFKKFIDTLTVRIGHEKVMEYVHQLHQGFVLQLMNGPLDLLVEDRIYRNYPNLRPLQLLTLYKQEMDNIASIEQGMKNPGIVPNQVLQTSKILNIVTSLHLKELYGLDFVQRYKPTWAEQHQAHELYEEYKAYRDDYQPGEEYDMMNYFVEQLDCEEFLSTINEKDYVARTEAFMGHESQEPRPSNDDFSEQHKDGANATETFMMSMYMVSAMQYFEGMPKSQIQRIAFEIAMLGCGGITPEKKSGYTVTSIPDKDFGGYELLAYYYVSWAIAIPEKLDALQLPFKAAYQTAVQLYQAKKGHK